MNPSLKIEDKKQVVEGKNIIVATGARSRELPNIPQDGKVVIGYREALTLKKQPKSMVVIGSGAIGSGGPSAGRSIDDNDRGGELPGFP